MRYGKLGDFAYRPQFMEHGEWRDCNFATDFSSRDVASRWAEHLYSGCSTRILQVRKTRQVSSSLPPQLIIKDGKKLEIRKLYAIKDQETDEFASERQIRNTLLQAPATDGWFLLDDGKSTQQYGWSHIIKVGRWVDVDDPDQL